MGVITGMLREHGYEEWDGEKGQMIGCSYDWRLNPTQLERRDKFFTRVNKAACVRLKMTYKGTESSVCWIDDGTDGSSSGCTRKACCSDRIQLGLQNCQGQGMCLPPESSLAAFQYFLHFCHAKRGDDWMGKHVDHFVPLGGPFLGAVPLLQAVMVVCSVYLCSTVSNEHMCCRMEPSHLWTFSFLR